METIDFDRVTMTPGMRVLDVGCGEGRHVHAAALENVAEVVGLDLERESLAAARDDYEEYIAGETDVPVTFLGGTRSGSPSRTARSTSSAVPKCSSTSPTTRRRWTSSGGFARRGRSR